MILNSQQYKALIQNDKRLIGRDSMLYGILLFLASMGLIFHFGLPWFNEYLAENNILPSENTASELSEYYPLIISFFVIFNASAMVGFLFGFILLDEKDDNTLLAMRVTPMPLRDYMIFRAVTPSVIGFLSVLLLTLFINQSTIPLSQLILISLGASLSAPITLLYLAIFAENKMQGFVYGKFISLAGWIIILSWFTPEPWQWLFGLFPPFWISKAYWLAVEGSNIWWVALLIGVIYQLIIGFLMLKLFIVRTQSYC